MKKILLIFTLIMLASADVIFAQCAMCKAIAETGTDNGNSVAAGLNDGILYLMAAPYILLGSIGFAYYKYASKKKQQA